MDCILVIDVQNGFLSDETRYVVPRIINLLDYFKEDIVVATKFVNISGSGYTDIMNWHRLMESPEIDIIPEIEDKSNIILEKNVYSAYCKELESIIQNNNIEKVYLVGIDTDCCVLKTAIDLFEHNIEPIVLADYCASTGGKESHNAAITVLNRNIGKKQITYGNFKGK